MGKKCALLMGLNCSNIRGSELYGCINDMNLTRNMLIDAYGYQEENMYIFRDVNFLHISTVRNLPPLLSSYNVDIVSNFPKTYIKM